MAPKKKTDPAESTDMEQNKKKTTSKQENATEVAQKGLKKQGSDSDSDEDKKQVKRQPAKKPLSKKASDSESDSDESDAPKTKRVPAKKHHSDSDEGNEKKTKKKVVTSSDTSDDSDDDQVKARTKTLTKPASKPTASSKPVAKPVAKPAAKPVVSESESEDSEQSKSEEDREDEETKTVTEKKQGNDDLDDILAEFGKDNKSAGANKELSKAQLKRLKKKQEEKAVAPAGGEEAKLSKAQAKKLKKQEAEAAKKEADRKAAEEKKKKEDGKEKKLDATVELIKKQREIIERAKREEEERIRQEQEAERLRQEEEERERLEKERKKEERRKKKELLRKEGKILTKTEKAAQAKNEAYIAQLKAQGLVPPMSAKPVDVGQVPDPEKVAEKPKTKVKYDKKKKPTKGPSQTGDKKDPSKENDKDEGEEDVPESWEVVAENDGAPAAKFAETEPAEVPDSWDVIDADAVPAVNKSSVKGALGTSSTTKVDSMPVQQNSEEKSDKAKKTSQKSAKEVKTGKEKAKSGEPDKGKGGEAGKEKGKGGEAGKEKGKGAEAEKEKDETRVELRSPICCILGHVDTGKTKLLDKIRHTNVQDHEAGGITQQIGATYFPMDTIKEQTKLLNDTLKKQLDYKVPGLLVIDTPGHESFTNLRSRGSNLCDIAILVVDIMHGLEPQTLESIGLLRDRKTPFIVALNKIDRMYGWKAIPNHPFQLSLAQQNMDAQREFEKRTRETIALFAEQGLNCCLYYENKDFRANVSLVPTSAITGEGIPDLLMLLVQLTQNMMNSRLMFLSDLQCTVLEVKVVDGLGTTIDVILVNGVLHEGQTIVLCGMEGPIVTTIRALLTPQPLKELRVKGEYVHHKMVKAAMGIKIVAQNMEHAIPGAPMLVCGPRDDIEVLKDEVMVDLQSMLTKVDRSGKGVYVQASTLGSLEALLEFLKKSKIPVSGIAIGPVRKKDVMKAAVMLEHQAEFATILAFDVKVSPDAHKAAAEMGVKIFTADIIYHLFDQCTKYMEEIRAAKRDAAAGVAVFPAILDIFPQHIFRARDPIVLGVKVEGGILKIGTPLCCPTKDMLMLGRVTSIQLNHVEVKEAKKGAEVAVRIEQPAGEQKIMYGRHFEHPHKIYSKLTRESIDLLKANFKDDLSEDDWKLVVKMKVVFGII